MPSQPPTLLRMEELVTAWETAGDRRGVFLDCYRRMTRAMHHELESGGFDDPAWVRELLDRFADRYFDALAAWEQHDPATPEPWVLAHEAAHGDDANAAQLLLAGVNAHINYDLVLTVAELVSSQPDMERRQADYQRVNSVIAATADEVQDSVLERWMPLTRFVDTLMVGLDEWLAVRLLTTWRSDVWDEACRLIELSIDERVAAEQELAEHCARRGRRILLGWP